VLQKLLSKKQVEDCGCVTLPQTAPFFQLETHFAKLHCGGQLAPLARSQHFVIEVNAFDCLMIETRKCVVTDSTEF